MTRRHRASALVLASALSVGLSIAIAPSASADDLPEPLQRFTEFQKDLEKYASLRTDAGLQSESLAPENCFSTIFNGIVQTTRAAGSDRYNTAVCVSLGTWADHDDPTAPDIVKAKAVVLARGDRFPDALAGGPLAAYAEAPLLLTTPTSLPAAVSEEIDRVLAPGGRIYLLGGPTSISNGIKGQLESAGYEVSRLAGSNRFETAVAVAEQLPDADIIFFATGMNFPDALAAGNVAAAISYAAKLNTDLTPAVVVLTNDDVMPVSTGDFVVERSNELGGVIPLTAGRQADTAVVDAFGEDFLIDELRFIGSNRFETATEIAEALFTDSTGTLLGAGVGLTTGLNFPDALAATSNLARFDQPILLTLPDELHPATEAFLVDHAGEHDPFYDRAFLDVFGGVSTISNAVKDAATEAFTP